MNDKQEAVAYVFPVAASGATDLQGNPGVTISAPPANQSGKQEAVYQQKVMGAWVDCNKQLYDAWPNEKRIVYAAPLAQRAERADAEKDAARYRNLRLNAYWWGVGNPTPEELDARIDAAILAAKEKKS